ncbi:protein rtoA-like [Uranotaenia lowii]|uniref:protein rtoA-like n=1 Tax=Uranotaenia lowii TaxID=190385 RepID=UPI00247A8CCC|nr:protein rtoA-like [Uranotaenia lowii]
MEEILGPSIMKLIRRNGFELTLTESRNESNQSGHFSTAIDPAGNSGRSLDLSPAGSPSAEPFSPGIKKSGYHSTPRSRSPGYNSEDTTNDVFFGGTGSSSAGPSTARKSTAIAGPSTSGSSAAGASIAGPSISVPYNTRASSTESSSARPSSAGSTTPGYFSTEPTVPVTTEPDQGNEEVDIQPVLESNSKFRPNFYKFLARGIVPNHTINLEMVRVLCDHYSTSRIMVGK